MGKIAYNVFIYNPNSKDFESHDVLPYLVGVYKQTDNDKKPKTIDEFKRFVEEQLRYRYWSRCEYEFVLKDWPVGDVEKKIDIYNQCCLNLDVITAIIISKLENGGEGFDYE